MTWADFEVSTILERDVLERAMPLVPQGTTVTRATLDSATDETQLFVAAADTSGPTPEGCVTLLKLRPLLFGTAWKVLDLFLEACFLQAGEQPDQDRGFSIKRKRDLARNFKGAPSFLPEDIWQAAALTYDATAEVRASLVHRKVYTDPTNALVGHDNGGGRLRPVTAVEQEALVRAALRLSEAAKAHVKDARTDADLRVHFRVLSGLHKVSLSGATASIASIRILTVIVDPEPDGSGYTLDIPHIRQWNPWPTAPYTDIVVAFRDRPGQNIFGRLEEAPNQLLLIDPDQPPRWLR
ncbi:hypothetical protein ACTAQJ_14875 [Arthrobacter sp. alpha11c]